MSETKCRICNRSADEASPLGLCTEHQEQVHLYVLRNRDSLTNNTKFTETAGYTADEQKLADERIEKLADDFAKAEARRKRREQAKEALLGAPRFIAFILISFWNAITMIAKSASSLATCIGSLIGKVSARLLMVPVGAFRILIIVLQFILKLVLCIITGALAATLMALSGLVIAGCYLYSDVSIGIKLVTCIATLLAARTVGGIIRRKKGFRMVGAATTAALISEALMLILDSQAFLVSGLVLISLALILRCIDVLGYIKRRRKYGKHVLRMLVTFGILIIMLSSISLFSGDYIIEEILSFYDLGIL